MNILSHYAAHSKIIELVLTLASTYLINHVISFGMHFVTYFKVQKKIVVVVVVLDVVVVVVVELQSTLS